MFSTSFLVRTAKQIGVFAAFLGIATSPAAATPGPITYTGGMHGGWGFFGGWMFLWPLLLLGLILYAVYQLSGGSTGGTKGSDDALAELRRRYARGELDEEEFDRRKRKLQG